jgi:arginine deiminase
MLFSSPPWAERAQQEHDIFTEVLRAQGVEVLYLTELVQDALEYEPARRQAVAAVLEDRRLGDELRDQLAGHLLGLPPEELVQTLIMGLARDEFRGGRGAVFGLLEAWDYIIEPLPNLVFVRDSSVWIGDSVAVTSPPGRTLEAELAEVVFTHHPMFAGTKRLYAPDQEELAGGDVLLLTPGVVAIGIGSHTAPAGMERLARRVFDTGFAHTVLAVMLGVGDNPDGACLDTLCTLARTDTVVMRPALAYSLVARTITQRTDGAAGLRLSHPQPFLEAAAQAMGIDRLRVIETGLAPGRLASLIPRQRGSGAPVPSDPVVQWDDAANLLVLSPGTVISYERNVLTNARLEDAGIEVIRVPGGELAGPRGGPRAICCPIGREPASMPDDRTRAALAGRRRGLTPKGAPLPG